MQTAIQIWSYDDWCQKKKMRRRAKILETEGMAVFVYQLMNLSGAEYKECRKIFDVPPRLKTHDFGSRDGFW